MLKPKILASYLAAHSNLPTQIPIGEGQYSGLINNTTPYYDKLIALLKAGHSRPSIPEYPQIADNIHHALDEVYYSIKEPKQVWMKRLINLQKYWVGEIYVRMSTRKFVSLYYDRMNGLRNGYILQILYLVYLFSCIFDASKKSAQ